MRFACATSSSSTDTAGIDYRHRPKQRQAAQYQTIDPSQVILGQARFGSGGDQLGEGGNSRMRTQEWGSLTRDIQIV
jgi:hypothetical protein